MRLSLTLFLVLMLSACSIFSSKDDKSAKTDEAEEIYAKAKEQMERADYTAAIKHFETLQSRFPYGRYAQQALTQLGAWPKAQSRLVRTENVRVALAFVERGEVGAGIVYETDAAASRKARIAAIFPPDSHAPISYPFAVVARNDSAAARQFIEFLGSPAAADVWRRHGFTRR